MSLNKLTVVNLKKLAKDLKVDLKAKRKADIVAEIKNAKVDKNTFDAALETYMPIKSAAKKASSPTKTSLKKDIREKVIKKIQEKSFEFGKVVSLSTVH